LLNNDLSEKIKREKNIKMEISTSCSSLSSFQSSQENTVNENNQAQKATKIRKKQQASVVKIPKIVNEKMAPPAKANSKQINNKIPKANLNSDNEMTLIEDDSTTRKS
jgi:ribosome assembly protein YihI (activator of Der GTPase)